MLKGYLAQNAFHPNIICFQEDLPLYLVIRAAFRTCFFIVPMPFRNLVLSSCPNIQQKIKELGSGIVSIVTTSRNEIADSTTNFPASVPRRINIIIVNEGMHIRFPTTISSTIDKAMAF